jgi:hypothetical protein
MGKNCFHIIATNKESSFQIWITADAFNLPLRYTVVSRNLNGNPQYEGTFSEWQINPDLPSSMFNFLPPPGAAKIRMLSKSEM